MGSVAGQLAIGAGLVAASFVPGLNVVVAGALLSAGVGIGLGAAAQAFTPVPKAESGPIARTVRSGVAFEQIPYGRVRIGGTMVAIDRHTVQRSGNDPDYLDLVIVVSARRIEAFRAIYIGDSRVELELNTNLADKFLPADMLIPTGGTYRGWVGVQWYVGTQVAANQFMIDRRGNDDFWTADHKLLGYAYAVVTLRYNQSIWAAGIPSISFEVDGVRVYDPRSGLTAWSDNVALCLADYLASEYGPAGVSYAEIDTAALIAAANVCDELVDEDAAVVEGTPGHERRYRLSTVISAENDWRSIAPDLALAMAGGFFRVGASWKLIAGATAVPTLTLGPDDMVGELDVLARRSRRDLFNRVSVLCRDAAALYQPLEVPLLDAETYLQQDDGVILPKEIDLSRTVASPSQALRIGSIELHQNRQQITATGIFKWRALTVEVGDVVLITSERMGWTAKPFRVVHWELDFAEGVRLGLTEYCDAVYAYPADAALFACTPSTSLSAPTSTTIVPSITVTRVEVGDSLIEWTAPSAFNLVGYDVRWLKIGQIPSDGYAFGNGSWIGLEDTYVSSTDFIAAGTLQLAATLDWDHVYRVEVRALLAGGIYGDWRAVTSFPNE